jgi:hypothetical protein
MKKAVLLFALMWNDDKKLNQIEEILLSRYGRKILETPPFTLSYSTYYQKEMGEGLKKKFVALDLFIQKDQLVEVKLKSMELEKDFSINGKRTVNIDPLYLDDFQVVVSSKKDKGSRIYIGKGIFAELELLYHHGSFQPLIWTYLDYKENVEFFNEVRKYYLGKV